MTILRTRKADQDFEAIADYLMQHNPKASRRYELKLIGALSLIEEQPFMGRDRWDISSEIRSWPVTPYVIFYRVSGGVIEVVRVLHMAQAINVDCFD